MHRTRKPRRAGHLEHGFRPTPIEHGGVSSREKVDLNDGPGGFIKCMTVVTHAFGNTMSVSGLGETMVSIVLKFVSSRGSYCISGLDAWYTAMVASDKVLRLAIHAWPVWGNQ